MSKNQILHCRDIYSTYGYLANLGKKGDYGRLITHVGSKTNLLHLCHQSDENVSMQEPPVPWSQFSLDALNPLNCFMSSL